MKYAARIICNDSATDGEYSKAKLAEYLKLGASIMVRIEGTDLAKDDDDLDLDLDDAPDAERFFGINGYLKIIRQD
jgi:hypothetical protein